MPPGPAALVPSGGMGERQGSGAPIARRNKPGETTA